MAIPKNISREHLLKAIEKIDKEGFPKDADSQYYDVKFNDKTYPPKVVVSFANIFANGVELNRNSFAGGSGTECFRLLENNGFQIIEKAKMSFHNDLVKFINQAQTNDLGTSRNNYSQEFLELEVKISFGQGGPAKIPWISFLAEGQTTSNGIYPVYLYFKDQNVLILAYGISVTNTPESKWNLKQSLTITDYFAQKNLGIPFKYGNSFVYKVYDSKNLPSPKTIDSDLFGIIEIYKSIKHINSDKPVVNDLAFNFETFSIFSRKAGLTISNLLIERFLASLTTKPFVILTGLSGSGKTKLAQAFVHWISESSSQYLIVPVGADWTNREPLLGYPSALNPEEYVKPDSGVLDLILLAIEQPDLPYFLILDEMNLSHVERYFADFLSAMESKEDILLHDKDTVANGIPSRIKIPSNLFIIGTVNIDETTNMFSPKVLDRANTIEFRISANEMLAFLENVRSINMDALFGKGAGMAPSFLQLSSRKEFPSVDIKLIQTTLINLFKELSKTGAEFGYRSATEILRLISQLSILDSTLTTNQKIDIAIIQKLLPKLHGSRRKLCPVLETLGTFCVTGDVKIVKDIFDNGDFDFNGENVIYPLSLEKISRMYRGAIDNGFASFAEA
jgi:5-methylcytosine-specific restriction protein B